MNPGQGGPRDGKFPTHNTTHKMRCLMRLPRTLADPAVLQVVVKPIHAALSRQRSRVRVSSSPPFFSIGWMEWAPQYFQPHSYPHRLHRCILSPPARQEAPLPSPVFIAKSADEVISDIMRSTTTDGFCNEQSCKTQDREKLRIHFDRLSSRK